MTLKQRILRWFGIDELFRKQAEDFAARLAKQTEDFEFAIELQEGRYRAELAAQKAEFESRSGVLLEASITASEKIARMVASQGDKNLKEYVDSCMTIFEQTAISQLVN